jgi:hypothetical protein
MLKVEDKTQISIGNKKIGKLKSQIAHRKTNYDKLSQLIDLFNEMGKRIKPKYPFSIKKPKVCIIGYKIYRS